MNGHWDGSIPGAVAPWQGPIMAAPALWPVPGASWPLSGMNAMWNGAHGPVDPRWKTTSCSHFEQSGFCPRGPNCPLAHGVHELRRFDADCGRQLHWCNHPYQYTGQLHGPPLRSLQPAAPAPAPGTRGQAPPLRLWRSNSAPEPPPSTRMQLLSAWQQRSNSGPHATVPVASPGSEVAAGAGLPKIQAGHASPGKAEEEPGARRKRDEQQLLSRLDSWTLRARKLGDWSWPPILVDNVRQCELDATRMVEEMEHASLTLLTHGKAYQAELVRLRQYVAAAQDAIAHHLAEQKESLVALLRQPKALCDHLRQLRSQRNPGMLRWIGQLLGEVVEPDGLRLLVWHAAVTDPDADTLDFLAGAGRRGSAVVAAAKPWACTRMRGDGSEEQALLHEVVKKSLARSLYGACVEVAARIVHYYPEALPERCALLVPVRARTSLGHEESLWCPSDSSGVTALKLAVLLPANVGMINSLTPVKAGTALWWLSDCGSPPRLCLEDAITLRYQAAEARETGLKRQYSVIVRVLTRRLTEAAANNIDTLCSSWNDAQEKRYERMLDCFTASADIEKAVRTALKRSTRAIQETMEGRNCAEAAAKVKAQLRAPELSSREHDGGRHALQQGVIDAGRHTLAPGGSPQVPEAAQPGTSEPVAASGFSASAGSDGRGTEPPQPPLSAAGWVAASGGSAAASSDSQGLEPPPPPSAAGPGALADGRLSQDTPAERLRAGILAALAGHQIQSQPRTAPSPAMAGHIGCGRSAFKIFSDSYCMPKDGVRKGAKAAAAWEEAKAKQPELLEPFYEASVRDFERLRIRQATRLAKREAKASAGGSAQRNARKVSSGGSLRVEPILPRAQSTAATATAHLTDAMSRRPEASGEEPPPKEPASAPLPAWSRMEPVSVADESAAMSLKGPEMATHLDTQLLQELPNDEAVPEETVPLAMAGRTSASAASAFVSPVLSTAMVYPGLTQDNQDDGTPEGDAWYSSDSDDSSWLHARGSASDSEGDN